MSMGSWDISDRRAVRPLPGTLKQRDSAMRVCTQLQVPEKEQYTRRPRTVFSQNQLAVLMDAFEKDTHPDTDAIHELQSKLNLEEAVIKIPYSQKVSLPVGSTVTIRGKANNAFRKEPRMQVDFHTGPTERSDIAFSFQVYFGKFVIMNSFQNPGWGPEVKFFDMPFAEDTQFELCISALDNEYQVSLNGKYYHSFAYRMPLSSVQMIQIPYSRNVSLPVGSTVTIRGKANNAFRKDPQMQVDFHTGTNEQSNIAFSFQVYFGKFVIMNTLQNDGWGTHEKSLSVPFEEDTEFELHILVLQKHYQISVNGKQCCIFVHRTPVNSVQMIQVWRDVSLISVNIQEGPYTHSPL
ncbi:Eosinophil lysophospholipase [Fukomys damarensis]|uniref:Galectin n=1 Tax=Fukomys damarensis TaxID=885580 RepID=A0A091CPB2_FUKDA|nr:Eosinophil lysophospholipase [Fukomys damarensis]